MQRLTRGFRKIGIFLPHNLSTFPNKALKATCTKSCVRNSEAILECYKHQFLLLHTWAHFIVGCIVFDSSGTILFNISPIKEGLVDKVDKVKLRDCCCGKGERWRTWKTRVESTREGFTKSWRKTNQQVIKLRTIFMLFKRN